MSCVLTEEPMSGLLAEQSSLGALEWSRLLTLGLLDYPLNLPLGSTDHTGRRQSGLLRRLVRGGGELTGESVRLDIPGTGSVLEGVVEPAQKQSQLGLARV